jgi:alpha-tubulin suppressor-like RCC1 family protein
MKLSTTTLLLALAAAPLAAHGGTDTRLPGPFPVIATGDTHTLFIRPDGWVWSWGDNAYGQLGDDTNTTRFNPVAAQLAGAVTVSAGVQFSVALMGDGNILTWGRNDVGQLGLGTKTTSKTANRIPKVMGNSLGEWRFVTAGRAHALAIKIDGTLWGWGDNANGQLGLGGGSKLVAQTLPQRIGTGADWVAAAAGKSFSVALRADGTLWAAGINDKGQLGNTSLSATGANVLTQVGVTTDRWLKVAAGTNFVAAIKDDGALWTWGMNDQGQLGDGTKTNHTAPARAAGGPFLAISAGDRHTLAVRWDGVVQACGYNGSGELGIGSTTSKSTLTTISGQLGEAIAAGRAFSAFLSADGYLKLSGAGDSGQLGAGGVVIAKTPYAPYTDFPNDWFAYGVKPNTITLGTNHTVAIRSDGVLEAWGDNRYRQLGPDTTASPSPSPQTQWSLGWGWLQVAGGDYHTLGVRWDGKLFAWGGNAVGELGIGSRDDSSHPQPTEVLAGKKAMRAALHYESSLALTADGLMYGWGDNSSGQLGVGSAAGAVVTSPKALGTPGGSRWVALGISNTRGAAVRSDGTLWVWGRMSGGTPTYTPVQVGTDKNWVTVGLGGADSTTAIKADGRIYAINNGTTATQIATGLRANMLSVTHSATLVTVSGGRVYGWGDNSLGQQGNGKSFGTDPSTAPSYSYFYNPRVLTGGGFFTAQVVSNGGGRQIAGDNALGQLGIGYSGFEMDDPVIISNGFDR